MPKRSRCCYRCWKRGSVCWVVCSLTILLSTAGTTPALVLVEAHRGYSAIAPENTLASIRAGEGIADLTEWDVYPTSDGALVLMHDSTVDRTTNGTGAVSSLTLAQIKTLDACYLFCTEYAGEPVPTMAEAITQATLSGITPLIERKGGSASAYHSEFLTLGLDPATFRMISFDWNFLSSMAALNPAYNLGALGSGSLTQSTIDGLKAQGIDFVDWNHSSVTQSTVDLVHANDMELHVWTVNDAARMQQLIDVGVDGITTDQPATLSQLVMSTIRTADLNLDSVVDEVDWNIANSNRGKDFAGLSEMAAYHMGDMDGDFDNDAADFVRFKELYLGSMNTFTAGMPVAVPEPLGAFWVTCLLPLMASHHARSYRQEPGLADATTTTVPGHSSHVSTRSRYPARGRI